MATSFETDTCGRCAGSGHYSYNAVNGTRCFGCGGSGQRLTKRGAAAKSFFESLISKPLSEIKVGDNILTATGSMGMGPNRWHFVAAIEPSMIVFNGAADRMEITFKRKGVTSSVSGYALDSVFQSVRNEEERAAALEKALAYQSTLTKAGKPASRRAAA